jgi:hypothetical protein
MASLMLAVARIALNLRPPVAASCLARIASTTARGERRTGRRGVLAVGPVVIDVEAEDVAVFDGVGDRVLVQAVLEEVFAAPERLDVAGDLLDGGGFLKDRRPGEGEELRLGEELLDGLVVGWTR